MIFIVRILNKSITLMNTKCLALEIDINFHSEYSAILQQQKNGSNYYFNMISKQSTHQIISSDIQSERQVRSAQRNKLQMLYQQRRFTQRKYTSLISLKKIWNLKTMISNMTALIPMKYRPEYRFEEEWQKCDQENKQEQPGPYKPLFKHTDRVYMLIQSSLMIYCLFMLILLSIKDIFGMDRIDSGITTTWIICTLLDMVINAHTSKIENNRHLQDRKNIYRIFFRQQFIYDLICIMSAFSINYCKIGSPFAILTTIMAMAAELVKISRKYPFFKTLIIDLQINSQFRILQLFGFMLFMGHLFGIIMYSSSFIAPTDNWLTKYGIQYNGWASKYVYSLYWAITTMVTVGYGDITPANEYEVTVVMFVQIVGTAIFGYMINVIGMTLSDWRKEEQSLEEDLSLITKLSKYFSLTKDLTFRLKNYIQNEQISDCAYTIQDQQRIRSKLNTELNNQIIDETNTRIIKKCLFFLTYFTRNFQHQVAMKLIMKIFEPKQYLDQNSFSTFIIEKGNVEIFYKKKIRKKNIFKRLRTIKENDQGIHLNVFNYTKTITGRALNLAAKCLSLTVAYELTQKNFMELLHDNLVDYQVYCQLKDTINRKICPEAIQGPLLTNPRYHYYPNPFIVLKRHTYSPKQKRRKIKRCHKKCKLIYNGCEDLVKEEIELKHYQSANYQSVSKIEELNRYMSNDQTNLDINKIYDNYFKKSNADIVLCKYVDYISKKLSTKRIFQEQ